LTVYTFAIWVQSIPNRIDISSDGLRRPSRNTDADSDELQAIIDGAVREAHAEKRTKRKAEKD